MRTGSKNIVCNTWSDAARQAANEARQAGAKAKESSKVADMKQTRGAHNDAMHNHIEAHQAMQKAAGHMVGDDSKPYEKEAMYHQKVASYHKEKSQPNLTGRD